MLQARMMGNHIQNLVRQKNLPLSDLAERLHCSMQQLLSLFKGRAFLSFPQLNALADCLDVPVSDLLQGNAEEYDRTVVHCMNSFQDPNNREKILDLIDDYMDLYDAVESK